jgi:hypothetical protein
LKTLSNEKPRLKQVEVPFVTPEVEKLNFYADLEQVNECYLPSKKK